MTLRAGVAVGFTCPDCQTLDENAEAVVNESTVTYSHDADGRVRGHPKSSGFHR